eukprot:4470728-Lingulodinium_polyedra.AAC.1
MVALAVYAVATESERAAWGNRGAIVVPPGVMGRIGLRADPQHFMHRFVWWSTPLPANASAQ